MADREGVILEDVARQITVNLDVYDVDGQKVGTVAQYDVDAGWMTVQRGILVARDLYIPFSLITNIDPREVYVGLPRDVLQRDYSNPPARTTVAAMADDLGLVETIATTKEPSGYDGTAVVVEQTRVDDVRRKITRKMHVYAATGEGIGTITHYDPVSGWMVVEKGPITRQDLRIPVSVVDAVDPEEKAVYLTVSKNDLQRLSEAAPAEVQVLDVQVG